MKRLKVYFTVTLLKIWSMPNCHLTWTSSKNFKLAVSRFGMNAKH